MRQREFLSYLMWREKIRNNDAQVVDHVNSVGRT